MESIEKWVERQTEQLEHHYVTAGNRALVIGALDGGFPDFGHHMKDEMGGVWDHPIKLLDGFWLRIEDEAGYGNWLEGASEFRNYPLYNEHDYALSAQNLKVIRRQFVPDDLEGVVVRYRILDKANSGERHLKLSFLGRTDLSPVWFGDENGIMDGVDEGTLDKESGVFVGRDTENPWYVVFGSDRRFTDGQVDAELFGPERTSGQGVSGLLTYEGVTVPSGGSVDVMFFIAGSYQSEDQARSTFSRLESSANHLLTEKTKRYQEILERSAIETPDTEFNKILAWVKFHNDWLVREVPEVGRGLGAGHPEYSWWFGCDNSYSLLGVLALGDFELVKDTVRLLAKVSEKENGNGRIVHEINTFGHVYNKGNTQETSHFIKLLWDVFQWTGDREFLNEYYPLAKKGIQWLLEEMDADGDLFPEGYGIIEIEGLNLELIDTAVYTQQALVAVANMAEVVGESDWVEEYRALADKVRKGIEESWWIESEGLYADARGTSSLLATRMDVMMERAIQDDRGDAVTTMKQIREIVENDPNPNEERAWEFKNWVINTPMEVGIAERSRAIRALDRMATSEFTGPWGTYLSGMHRNQMMTISTGVQAVAEAQYDRMDNALKLMQLVTSTFGKYLAGSITEMSPDYGCFVQAWTVYALYWPMVTHLFGIRPNAHQRTVTVRPRLPEVWDSASIRQVRLGSGEASAKLDVAVQKDNNDVTYTIRLSNDAWTIRLCLPETAQDVTVNGISVKTSTSENGITIDLQAGNEMIIQFTDLLLS